MVPLNAVLFPSDPLGRGEYAVHSQNIHQWLRHGSKNVWFDYAQIGRSQSFSQFFACESQFELAIAVTQCRVQLCMNPTD